MRCRIKAARQGRRLFAYLVFQSVAFNQSHRKDLQAALAANRELYFAGFLNGIDQISPRSVDAIVGAQAPKLRMQLRDATRLRNKNIPWASIRPATWASAPPGMVACIRQWCDTLAEGAEVELGYDGFGRNSFRKAAAVDLPVRLRNLPGSLAEFGGFLATSRKDASRKWLRSDVNQRIPMLSSAIETALGTALPLLN